MSKTSVKNKAKKRKAFLVEMRKQHGPDYGKVRCDSCEQFFEESEIISGPDPYVRDVFNRIEESSRCLNCHRESIADI